MKGGVRRGSDANPVVKVLPDGADSYRAVCLTPDCDWDHTSPIKAGCEEQARWHRQAHRRTARALEEEF